MGTGSGGPHTGRGRGRQSATNSQNRTCSLAKRLLCACCNVWSASSSSVSVCRRSFFVNRPARTGCARTSLLLQSHQSHANDTSQLVGDALLLQDAPTAPTEVVPDEDDCSAPTALLQLLVSTLRTSIEVGGASNHRAHLEVLGELGGVGVAVEVLWVQRTPQRQHPQVLLHLFGRNTKA